jgi:hypothetical protein
MILSAFLMVEIRCAIKNTCFSLHQPAQVIQYFFFCTGIYRGKAIVKNQYFGRFDQCPGNGDPLFLSAGKVIPLSPSMVSNL